MHRGFDLENDAGGIREIELHVHALQLIHAGKRAPLRPAARAIERLDQGYTLLRTIEHRMRGVHDQALLRPPDARDELDKLARRSGFLDGGALLACVERWQHDIRAAYLRVLGA